MVLVYYDSDNQFYLGRVKRVLDGGNVHVVFMDGDEDESVDFGNVRRFFPSSEAVHHCELVDVEGTGFGLKIALTEGGKSDAALV